MSFIRFDNLRDEFESLKNNTEKLRRVCYETKFEISKFNVGEECKSIVTQLEFRINNIEDKNSLIFHKSHRMKRAFFNGVGNLAR